MIKPHIIIPHKIKSLSRKPEMVMDYKENFPQKKGKSRKTIKKTRLLKRGLDDKRTQRITMILTVRKMMVKGSWMQSMKERRGLDHNSKKKAQKNPELPSSPTAFLSFHGAIHSSYACSDLYMHRLSKTKKFKKAVEKHDLDLQD
ncbi:hypothetical protein OIU84_000934 [Salix udensis]|uniref:Uncharacterized protein n=1 Tax=Salix udensis TaxID=889485 RepID=A0AAD6PMZ0_9ROSI|nr:hypothetical protein OIU84_000934 [Salix udensis]